MRRSCCAVFFLLTTLILTTPVASGQKRPFDVDALLQLKRVSDPQLSPDGKFVAFTVTSVDLGANKKPSQIWIIPIEGDIPARPLTNTGTNDRPRWTSDAKSILFASTRSGSQQIWSMEPDGGNAKQITNLATEANGVTIAPDGKRIVFLSSVYPDCGIGATENKHDDTCNKRKLDEEATNKVKARIYTSLLYRHWNEWQGKRRSHVLSCFIDNCSTPKDLTPGNRDVPTFSLGGPDDYAISPDSKEVAFVMNADDNVATSTNTDIHVVNIEGGEIKKVTNNTGADVSPQYSPDGHYLAYRSQLKAGYEADRWRLTVLDRTSGRYEGITERTDRNVTSFTWTLDSKRFFFITEDRGRHNVQQMASNGGGSKPIITGSSSIDDVQFTRDGKTIIYTEMSGSRPTEIYKASSTGTTSALTKLNENVLSQYSIAPLEEIWVEGAEKTRIHSFIVKPPGFDAKKKYPVLFLIHGGPQGAWGESWSYRWNPQVFAGAGFVVVMPNPRGSTGYGQKFTDDINADWGGKVYEDIMATVDNIANQPWSDSERFAAAGGSYGGYMVNWMLGHTNRFKAFVSHAGVFDLRSMAAETEEVWFPLWEFKGMPWENPEVYEKWSPSYFVRDFKTPTLVLHGEMDYRVPAGQGMQLFTGLQMQKVPSKMVLFPDEGHWIGKPQNSVLWYQQFLEWIGEWTKKTTPPQP